MMCVYVLKCNDETEDDLFLKNRIVKYRHIVIKKGWKERKKKECGKQVDE